MKTSFPQYVIFNTKKQKKNPASLNRWSLLILQQNLCEYNLRLGPLSSQSVLERAIWIVRDGFLDFVLLSIPDPSVLLDPGTEAAVLRCLHHRHGAANT